LWVIRFEIDDGHRSLRRLLMPDGLTRDTLLSAPLRVLPSARPGSLSLPYQTGRALSILRFSRTVKTVVRCGLHCVDRYVKPLSTGGGGVLHILC
jgi:hypothetical protein